MGKILKIMALLLGAISSKANATPESDFWNWFQQNENALYSFEGDQEKVFDRLTKAIHKVDPNLTFEFGPKKDNKREFVISADGIKSSFPIVESLYAAAPNLSKWTFIKFRPRRAPFNLKFKDIEVVPSDVVVVLEQDGQKAGLSVFISGFAAARKKEFTNIAYLFLDQALGEYDVETKVGFISVDDRAKSPKGAITIDELPKAFDQLVTR